MMGFQRNNQHKLFISGFNLEERVHSDHVLRKTSQKIDFDFIYDEVKETYGSNGNVSVPPPLILKLMLLLIRYNVRSERDTYWCPVGQELKKTDVQKEEGSVWIQGVL
jgi:transposase